MNACDVELTFRQQGQALLPQHSLNSPIQNRMKSNCQLVPVFSKQGSSWHPGWNTLSPPLLRRLRIQAASGCHSCVVCFWIPFSLWSCSRFGSKDCEGLFRKADFIHRPPSVGWGRLKPPTKPSYTSTLLRLAAQACSLDLYILGDWHFCPGAYVTCLKRAERDLQCHYLSDLLEAP